MSAALGQIMVPPRQTETPETEQMSPREVVAASPLELLQVRLDRSWSSLGQRRAECLWQEVEQDKL